jgi:hypothetical protein
MTTEEKVDIIHEQLVQILNHFDRPIDPSGPPEPSRRRGTTKFKTPPKRQRDEDRTDKLVSRSPT